MKTTQKRNSRLLGPEFDWRFFPLTQITVIYRLEFGASQWFKGTSVRLARVNKSLLHIQNCSLCNADIAIIRVPLKISITLRYLKFSHSQILLKQEASNQNFTANRRSNLNSSSLHFLSYASKKVHILDHKLNSQNLFSSSETIHWQRCPIYLLCLVWQVSSFSQKRRAKQSLASSFIYRHVGKAQIRDSPVFYGMYFLLFRVWDGLLGYTSVILNGFLYTCRSGRIKDSLMYKGYCNSSLMNTFEEYLKQAWCRTPQ